jgi:regulation of enolase protein 1 (concanavalin A-like superfamily)
VFRNVIHVDCGNPRRGGSATSIDDGYEITAGGSDIWGARDECHFLYEEQDGDFDFRIRFESLSPTDLYTKAGIMARESIAEDARHVYCQILSNNNEINNNNGGYEYQYRQVSGQETKAIYPHTAGDNPRYPVNFPKTWVRLVRRENVFTGYFSADGKRWDDYAAFGLDLPRSIFLGVAVTSHNPNELITARFRDITHTERR